MSLEILADSKRIDENIWKQGVLVRLSIGGWSGKVKIGTEDINNTVDEKFFDAIKWLVGREAFKPTIGLAGATRNYLYGKSLKFPIPGAVFVPMSLIKEVVEELNAYNVKYALAADALELEYQTKLKTEALEKLGEYFNPAEYPQTIRGMYYMTWQLFTMTAPGELQYVDQRLAEEQQTKFRETVDAFVENSVQALRQSFADMVGHAIGQLTDPDKRVNQKMLDKFTKFIADFEKLNICDDKELANELKSLEGWITDVDTKQLKSNEQFKGDVIDRFKNIKTTMDSLLFEERGQRMIQTLDLGLYETEEPVEEVAVGELAEQN